MQDLTEVVEPCQPFLLLSSFEMFIRDVHLASSSRSAKEDSNGEPETEPEEAMADSAASHTRLTEINFSQFQRNSAQHWTYTIWD